MRIVLIGAGGTIGRAVAAALADRHEVIAVSRRSSPGIDLAEPQTIDALFDAVPEVDAVVSTAASVRLARFGTLSDEELAHALRAKLFGQIALLQRAVARLREGGSVTLTGGSFDGVLPGGSAGALANAGLEAFVAQAAPELPRGLRANVVAPGWVRETLDALDLQGPRGTPAREVAKLYVQAVEGAMSGQALRALVTT
ncbi:short chain dehydrogenase [Variovorax sp. NFACC27]|uniref:short chain dehydrogenase n=1 Tax=unclassified Variovorax TaxID=663243 RepID=UPI0008958E9E|nr:short chain dehydrogenase [Variovorax sp. YR750]SEF22729.1 NAD(P)-dependent dehydrogenase, short-chain alcohol dehydrogenase family [Variovorax sp. NFACC28]SEF98956.1 NAD(P)-dependent dehydrogenase, short-chain alcohol dehydrogenase family [Variovorax sp. NFACC29]SFB94229.1 NAD(P)-dependent dehydrogenase, short-chain alcohol dehydrogenase family [Variovorax sp. NFACC26]SFF81404.1 NAD(P)-dependent dehydrogenase, short-chain alcohol dehydrogenase family [Variovorax sp. NFACC27]SEK65353.1 NAD(